MKSKSELSTSLPISISNLKNSTGESYLAFRKNLTPNYKLVWSQIVFGYLVLTMSVWLADITSQTLTVMSSLQFLIASLMIGYTMAFLGLFLHEGSHYGIASDRKLNDRLSNILFGWFTGTSISQYRKNHWQHHLHLGHTIDPENSYFSPLTPRTLLEGFVGVTALRKIFSLAKSENPTSSKTSSLPYPLFVGIFCHLLILLLLVANNMKYSAIAWVLGVFFVFPFFGWLRQLLEHRSVDASIEIDYRLSDHGAINRMFGNDFFSQTMGGAGFNRHLLHHWDPTISFTNFDQLESFILQSEYKEALESTRTTYLKTFRQLIKSSNAKN